MYQQTNDVSSGTPHSTTCPNSSLSGLFCGSTANVSGSRPTAQFANQQEGPFYVPENYAYMPNVFQSQATMLPHAFQTMTIQDPAKNMDTGASSHSADNTESRSTPCIFLCYPANHRGYRCLDLASNKIIISRHVRFDEDVFSFENVTSSNKPTYDFLLPPIQTTTNVFTTKLFVQQIDELNNPITPHLTTPPTSPPQPDTPSSHSSTPFPPQPDTHLSHSLTPITTSAQTQSHPQTVDSHTPIPINNSSQTMSTHPMVTRAKAGIFKQLERMNCHVTTTSPLPRSHVHALRDPNWKEAMLDEYNALITNRTGFLVPCPANVNVVRSVWLFKHKFNADGSLSRYKARLVANGRSQQQGLDCDETFSLVVKPDTIRTVLSLAVSREWPIHQLDVKNAFLHGHLSETVYMHQSRGFVNPNKPNYVCHLQRSLYGLSQPRVLGFRALLVMLHDLITSSSAFLQWIIASLHNEFAMKDLGSLNYFLSISTQRSASGLFLSQSKFAEDILERAHMQNCNPCRTPVDTESKLGSDGDPVSDTTLYRSLTGALRTYIDADWAGCPITRRSTSGYCVFLGDNLLSWSAKRHVTLSRSSAEAEYRGVVNVVAETAWIRNLLCELHTPLFTATLVYCDNVSAVYMSVNSVQHQRTKHIDIDIHFVCDFVASGQVRVLHVPSRFQYADIFTNGLPTALFIEFRFSLTFEDLLLTLMGINSHVYELSLLSCLSIISCHSYLDVSIMSCQSYFGLKPILFVSINTLYIAEKESSKSISLSMKASRALKHGKSMIIAGLAKSKKDHAIELFAKLEVRMDELQTVVGNRKREAVAPKQKELLRYVAGLSGIMPMWIFMFQMFGP
nr:hypothetical protein [Tanacetum cinerariifolium]